jgi:mono/diheme cytochrome c family protein
MRIALPVLLPVLLLVTAAFAGKPAAAATAGDIAHGEALVKLNCSQCHAVGRDDYSAHPDAPEFRKLSERYPIDDLAEALAEGIVTGHPDMPEFQATPEQISDIISYLKSIQD